MLSPPTGGGSGSPAPGHHHVWASGTGTGTTPSLFPDDDQSSPSTIWRFDEFAQDPDYLAYQSELRDLIFTTATHAAPTREASPTSPHATTGGGGTTTAVDIREAAAAAAAAASHHHDGLPTSGANNIAAAAAAATAASTSSSILSHGRRLEYLRAYTNQVAPWLDMFDSSRRTFGIQVPSLARTSPALLFAILALAARQKERLDGSRRGADGNGGGFDSLELYQEAIRLLTPLLQAHDPQSVPICTILCAMEMMSASARDWRKHLEGCAALFDAFGVHGFSGGLYQAVFWCYARMDLCGALISDGTQGTLVPPAKWLSADADADSSPDAARHLFRAAAGGPDAHANYAVYLCARVCWLTADRTRFVELGEVSNGCTSAVFAARWEQLWADLQLWLDDRPAEMLPAQTLETRPFPQILFAHWAAISSTQLYHTACILLLNMLPRSVRAPTGTAGSATWHARRICGISLTNPHEGCLNNAIQPLWVAGRLLSHKSEHALIAKLIRQIEAKTGWGSSWRIADLEAVWGYKVHRT